MNHFAVSTLCTTLLVATSLAQTPDWIQMTPANSPADRAGHTMVYDSQRGVSVMFGGFASGVGNFNDTWEYDGSDWIQVTTASSPSARSAHAMAYDSERGKVVFYRKITGQNSSHRDGARVTSSAG